MNFPPTIEENSTAKPSVLIKQNTLTTIIKFQRNYVTVFFSDY